MVLTTKTKEKEKKERRHCRNNESTPIANLPISSHHIVIKDYSSNCLRSRDSCKCIFNVFPENRLQFMLELHLRHYFHASILKELTTACFHSIFALHQPWYTQKYIEHARHTYFDYRKHCQ